MNPRVWCSASTGRWRPSDVTRCTRPPAGAPPNRPGRTSRDCTWPGRVASGPPGTWWGAAPGTLRWMPADNAGWYGLEPVRADRWYASAQALPGVRGAQQPVRTWADVLVRGRCVWAPPAPRRQRRRQPRTSEREPGCDAAAGCGRLARAHVGSGGAGHRPRQAKSARCGQTVGDRPWGARCGCSGWSGYAGKTLAPRPDGDGGVTADRRYPPTRPCPACPAAPSRRLGVRWGTRGGRAAASPSTLTGGLLRRPKDRSPQGHAGVGAEMRTRGRMRTRLPSDPAVDWGVARASASRTSWQRTVEVSWPLRRRRGRRRPGPPR